MDIPQKYEHNLLRRFANDRNELMHWSDLYSWISETASEKSLPANYRAIRGCRSPDFVVYRHKSVDDSSYGFRPVFDCQTPDELPDDLKTGDVIVIGTLYMGESVVPVPQEFSGAGVTVYEKGTKLTLREPVDTPDMNIWGIYIGYGTFIADRPVLRHISFEDIEEALKSTPSRYASLERAEKALRSTTDPVEP